ncbi:hypothetical protein SAMN05660461_3849 [Chitinophaga ginsengisegetis]|uniref:Chaperone of endosialidase n=1 Tax=Chitinophaga ginsengisegetis TaxID=393003 RepID=A0A1T5P5D3_9BACT|nr:hypothetical protein [Chitinophaga ginsengisegetis]SKD07866.1 hypothetical protein SAMN05660461_3849 [Chitinophaga ginsengisegetis]
MKRTLSLLLLLTAIVSGGKAQTYINNQTTLQPSSNFYISGTAQSNTLKTTAGTSATGMSHFHMFTGDGNTPANLRWTQAFIGLEGASNAGADFRIFRYSNTGAFLGTGLAIERATGNVIVNNLTAANASKIQGTGTAANQSYLQFMQSDNITRDGYVGMGSGANKDIYLVSDNGNINLNPKTGGGAFQVASAQVQNTTGTFLMSNATSNNISFNAVGLAGPSFTTRSIGSKVILWNAPLNATTSGWDVGMETNHMWFGIASASNAQGFKFYGGTTQIGRIDGMGATDWEGQGRFKGWYTANGTGPAAEIGISAGRAAFIGFDRTPGATKYLPVLLSGGTTATNQKTLIITDAGVGIGTLTPQSELSVKGTITAQRVKVTQTGWADYVFHKNYQLPSLAEVEAYVRSNQHLEGIPSAAEVEKEGIDVGEMNKKLLAKVEELTLYLIEQNKKITALEEWKKQQEKLSIHP